VRRAFTFALLAVIGFSLIAPGVLLDAESNLPGCCRRNGAHHCTMKLDETASNSGAPVQAIRQTCASFPAVIAVPARFNLALPSPSPAVFAALLTHPSGQSQTEARYRVSFSRSHQKRGPPSILS
jgi:hypothetical protein